MRYITIIFCFIFILSSCKKDDKIFNISIVNTSPISLQEFQENIMVELEYEHSQGFIGFYDPDFLSLSVRDSRLSSPDYYHLIPLNPPDNELIIQGAIILEIDAPFILGTGNSETLFYEIQIQDREGCFSNTVETPIISVIR